MKSSIILRRTKTSPLVKRVRNLVHKTCPHHHPGSDEVVSVDVRVRQADGGFAYTDELRQQRILHQTRTLGQNLDCYI